MRDKVVQQLKSFYFARKFGYLHTLHSTIASVEKALYRQKILSGKKQTLPTFLGIGATKAGTTWLYNTLSAHPDVYLPVTKELHYFDRRFDELLYIYSCKFKQANATAIGEITPAYSILPIDRIEFIRLLMPDVKLILILRNPIERAWSEAMHNLLRKDNKRKLADVPAHEIEKTLRSDAIVHRSQYCKILDNWEQVFPTQQLLVMLYDDLKSNPKQFLQRTFQHIGVTIDVDWQTIPYEHTYNVNPKTDIPPQFVNLLQEQYCKEIEQVKQRLGEKVAGWQC